MTRPKGSKNKPRPKIDPNDPRSFVLDAWQKRVINHKGWLVLRCVRQGGKSIAVSLKARKLANEYPGTTTLVTAASQRQASLLFEKIRAMLEMDNAERLEKVIKKENLEFSTLKKKRDWEKKHSIFEEEPTQTRIKLKNKSIIYCLPTGKTGAFIHGFTADFIIVDEAARVPDVVFTRALLPMLLTSRRARGTGWLVLLSTPLDKSGFYYESCHDDDFLQIHIPASKCTRIPAKEVKKARKRMTSVEYATEILAEFAEGVRRYFKEEVIEACPKMKSWFLTEKNPRARYYLGVDVARFGKDLNAFVIIEIVKKTGRIVYVDISGRKELTDTAGRILKLEKKFRFKKIFIDGKGVGGGVIDFLRENLMMSRKVIETNNDKRITNHRKETKTLKEDMYSTALIAMEQGRLTILKDKRLLKSLRSMTWNYNSQGGLKIYGTDSHLSEAFVRACRGFSEYRNFFIK